MRFRSLPRSLSALARTTIQLPDGLQNRNARFDSSVPRYKIWLYSTESGAVEPNRATTRNGESPLESAGIRSICGASVPTPVPCATSPMEACG